MSASVTTGRCTKYKASLPDTENGAGANGADPDYGRGMRGGNRATDMGRELQWVEKVKSKYAVPLCFSLLSKAAAKRTSSLTSFWGHFA